MNQRTSRLVAPLLIVGYCVALASCSSKSGHSALESVELLDMIQEQQKRHDPHMYVEIDLGKFSVTHPLANGDGVLLVQFHLYGVLPESRRSDFEAAMPRYTNRVRDAVISLVQQTETEHLADPGMAFFKSEMVTAINRVLQDQLLKDVAFSNLSIERS